jgi:hypothetical protein
MAGRGSIRALELILEDYIYLIKMELKKYYVKYLSKDEDDETEIDEINAEKDLEDVEEDKGSLLATPFLPIAPSYLLLIRQARVYYLLLTRPDNNPTEINSTTINEA